MARPEAVLVAPAMPAAGGNGLAMRSGLMLEGLARSFDVTVLVVPVFGTAAAPTELASALARETRILELDRALDPAADMIGRLQLPGGPERARALHPLPSLAHHATAAAARKTAEELAGADVALVIREYLAPLLDVVLEQPVRPALVLDVDDVESVSQAALGLPIEAQRFERLEAYYLPRVDHVITCSAADSQLLRERHGLQRLTPVPNAVRSPQPARATTADAHDLLFVGNLSYGPNVEAARWLCERVLPLLGEARLAIVGSDPAQQVLALAADPRVVVAPDVEDVAPWYENAAVAVVPVLRGGGSRIKLIEALAHRRPVVATSAGAAGLPWTDDESPVVIADAPEEFADACRALFEDRVRAAELAEAGETLVRERASVEVVAGQIDRLVRSIAGA